MDSACAPAGGEGERLSCLKVTSTSWNVATATPLFVHPSRRMNMDWNRVEGNWKQFKGNVKEKWGKLTDDDINVIEGKRDQLEGKIQQRYGYAKDQARKDVDDWFSTLK
jgi:uncharacterized protein YjbJ (UPF0337 family)